VQNNQKLIAIAIIFCYLSVAIASKPLIAQSPDWIARSNQFADILEQGISSKDCYQKSTMSRSLVELDPVFKRCRRTSLHKAITTIEQQLERAKNLDLRLDLEILLKYGKQELRSQLLAEKYRVPYLNISEAILDSFQSVLKESKFASQQQAAILSKLQQYAGMGLDRTSLTQKLEKAIAAQLQQSEIALPNQQQLQNNLDKNAAQVYKIEAFLKQQQVANYEEAYEQLKSQLFAHEKFLRHLQITRFKNDYVLPTELYLEELHRQGIEIPVAELIEQAHTAFIRVQQQMQAIAPQIARKLKLDRSDYRNVIAALKRQSLSADDTLHLYQSRAKQLEDIIRRENLVSLPQQEFKIRLATAREYQKFPVPLYDSESNTFVIPVLQNPQKAKLYNDFTNPAMSWTLTVHEGRPGHDLQFATIENQNLSKARTDFAANATSIEGWATYAEEMMQPYMPLEGKFMSLQFQLLRSARAFLEPELHLGKITTADALKVLTQDAGFSQFFAQQEIKRYISRFPGQAPSYFYGYQQLKKLRSQVAQIQGKDFNLKKFHDLILSQGFISPQLLRQIIPTKI